MQVYSNIYSFYSYKFKILPLFNTFIPFLRWYNKVYNTKQEINDTLKNSKERGYICKKTNEKWCMNFTYIRLEDTALAIQTLETA